MPETLLKKRKAQEKARENRNATIEKRKTVRRTIFFLLLFVDDNYQLRD